MTRIGSNIRFAVALGLASLGGASTLAAQSTPADGVASEADRIAQEADTALETIDPTTGLPKSANGAFERPTPAVEVVPRLLAQPLQEPDLRPEPQPEPDPEPVPDPAALRTHASAEAFTLKSILTIPEGPFRYGDWYWDESNAPAKGKLVVTVDLDARVISAFRDGHEIGTAVALLGTKKHPTPLGRFPILTKEKDNISEKYNNAPMPWTLRLTWNGIAIHGSPVINGYASHGCIGVPDEFAEKLFAAARRGDHVIITRGQTLALGDRLS
ncbi:MAG: L,D-transpeptidase family protein [Erythrobacter sp.]|uniref:L,D-transpeptidase family protein n=1 Tax=Erythrobacter sp. TaxID=1042 RepID=UPI002635C48D|nr:L,D-transpeptidase family protein [Erythrobacter sp.]MDJ0978943.1 L,D-transpeptidase family protein [Erythrobacter sp.]